MGRQGKIISTIIKTIFSLCWLLLLMLLLYVYATITGDKTWPDYADLDDV